nr:MAG TPA: hypothetical protein [Caudoviricetes sp.]
MLFLPAWGFSWVGFVLPEILVPAWGFISRHGKPFLRGKVSYYG